MLGFKSRLGTQPIMVGSATSALRRIQVFFWIATVGIVVLFAGINWKSYDHGLFRFTVRAVAEERLTTCRFVRYYVEQYLGEHGYRELLPGKGDTGLNELLADLVHHNPHIENIRIVDPQSFHVSTAGPLAPGILGVDLRDSCCTVFSDDEQGHAHDGPRDTDAIPTLHTETDSEPLLQGRFHDPSTLDVYCVEAPLHVDGQLVGRVAIHENNPLSREFYQEAKAAGRTLIYFVAGLLLLALAITISWTSRELGRIEERIQQGERDSSLASLAGGVAHEIRNPLNTIALSCTYLVRRLGNADPEARETLELIATEVQRLQATTTEFLRFTRAPRLQLTDVDVEEVIDSTLEVLGAELRSSQVTVARKRSSGLRVRADRSRLREVFLNLMRNAGQAIAQSGAPGEIRISTRIVRRQLIVEIADSGPGVSPEVRLRMFEPYFTTKAEGVGLGLAQVQQDVLAHGGEIEVAADGGPGARILVKLPLAGPDES